MSEERQTIAAAAPRISVLMPVYNRKEYAPLAVESVLRQTFGDFEFLIVDDGSTDGVSEILRGYADADPRVVLIEQQNTGYAIALNRGLQRARGEFVARMDSDDVCLPERFALQVAFLQSHPDVVAVGGQAVRIDEDGDPVAPIRSLTDSREIEQKLVRGLETREWPLMHPAAMMRREAVQQLGGYRPEFEPAEDRDLWLRLAEVGRLANLSETILHYRMHSGSVSNTRTAQQYAAATRAIEEAYQRRGLTVPETVYLRSVPGPQKSAARLRAGEALTAARHGNYRTARKHALKALRTNPFLRIAWKALAIGVLGNRMTRQYRRIKGRALKVT